MKQRLLSVFVDPRLLNHSRRFSWRRPCNHATIDVSRTSAASSLVFLNRLLNRSMHRNASFEKFRRWQPVTAGGNVPPQSGACARDRFDFTLMSYNILAQDLLDGHASLYDSHDPRALPWKHRFARLMAEIGAVQPDILCVQELQQNHVDQFRDGLSYDYGMLYKKRTGGDKTDGCAVFYRRDLFDLVTHHKVEYFQPNVSRLNRENVAIIAKLSLKANPRAQVVVSTTHLLYNPRRQDVRLAQVQLLLAELDRLAYNGTLANGIPKYHPVILCGDFNLQPFTAPYELLTKGYLRYDRLDSRTLQPGNQHGNGEQTGKLFLPPTLGITDRCQHDKLKNRGKGQQENVSSFDMTRLHHSTHHRSKSKSDAPESRPDPETGVRNEFSSGSLNHSFVFNSAYRHDNAQFVPKEQRMPTTFQEQWITVDYLFYTPYRSVAEASRSLPNWNLELLSTYTLPTVKTCYSEIGNIPDLLFGSDHFSLAGRFSLTIPKEKP